ncbi:hypothetical protein CVIRNUC_005739 [Coccomyxa viridis]|uniref:Uncharacterized protein n=1 Tax=Coccomyxa viridis TaxID=1274662 RepID=A0AAV1I642_9CHLO|nr:hypothetical protein CVIRNUC_005739 [Coccomyxa viridis]
MTLSFQPGLGPRGKILDDSNAASVRKRSAPAPSMKAAVPSMHIARLSLKHANLHSEICYTSLRRWQGSDCRSPAVVCSAASPSSGGSLNQPVADDLMSGDVHSNSLGSRSVSAEALTGGGETLDGRLKVGASEAAASRETPLTAWGLLKDTVSILYKSFWPLILIFAATDVTMYALHRVSHRITNQAAMSFLGIDAGNIGHLWYLSNNPAIANFETGYQYLVGVFFLFVFPLNVLLRSFAATLTVLYAWKNAGEPNECPNLQPSIIPPIRSMYKNISCIWPKMRTSLGRVWLVDLLVAVRVLPLQFASLLLVTLPLTMPRLLALQLANPASVVEELEGDEAIARSHELTKLRGVKKALLWPYVGLILALRAVSLGRSPILGALPTHVVKDVPEIPFAIYCSIVFLSVLLSRLQDVLPLAVFMRAHKEDRELKLKEKAA